MASDHTSLLATFRNDAQAYCAFIDKLRTDSAEKPYTNLLQLLSSLAKSAAMLPFDWSDEKVRDTSRMDQKQWNVIAGEIERATASVFAALMMEHANDEEALARSSMLWDDLADIYRDLQDGLALCAGGG